MPALLVWQSSVITQAIVDLLETNHVPQDVRAVYYSDQARIPEVPAAAVMSGNRGRNFNQTGQQYEMAISTYIMVYHGTVGDLQILTKDTEELLETLEATLNAARKLPDSNGDARIIHGLVSNVEPGFAERGKALFVVHRMTHTAISRHQVGL